MPSGRKPKPVDEEAVRRLFKSGVSVNQIRNQFKINHKRVLKIVGSDDHVKPSAKAKAPADEPLDAWDLTLNVPNNRLDSLLGMATREELLAAVLELSDECKAAAFQTFMQTRMYEITNQEAVSDGPTEAE